MKNIFGFISICTLFLSSCELSELPQATATEEDIFGTESGLKTYSYSFYNNITSGSDSWIVFAVYKISSAPLSFIIRPMLTRTIGLSDTG